MGKLQSQLLVVLSAKQCPLSSEKQKFESLVSGLNRAAIVAVTDKKGTITYVNDLFCKISGYTREELVGANHRILKSGIHPPEFFKEMWQTILKGQTWNKEVCNRRKDGSFYWVDTSITQIASPTGEPQYMAIRFDITEKNTALKKLIESSKMSSLGEMAGGIAHEINNPLAIIKGKAHRIKKQLESETFDKVKVFEELVKIETTTERIAKIIRGLRSFSRNASADPMERTAISTIIDDTLELCRERFKNHSIELRVECHTEIQVECRAAQISQVLVNLLGNAHDAVEKLSEKWVEVEVVVNTTFVTINITDSGKGIPIDVVDKMMQPFFTTKEVGKGTGLGLSISRGLVEDHHGRMYYDAKSKNTRFVMELPLMQPIAQAHEPEKKAA